MNAMKAAVARPTPSASKPMTSASSTRSARTAREPRLIDDKGIDDARQHEKRCNREYALPCDMVRENERKRTGNETRYAIRLHMNGIAEAELRVGQKLAAIGVEHDVLARGKECDRRRKPCDRP